MTLNGTIYVIDADAMSITVIVRNETLMLRSESVVFASTTFDARASGESFTKGA